MKLKNPIPVFINCNLTYGLQPDDYRALIHSYNGGIFSIDIPSDIVITPSKIIAEIHEIHEPNIFSVVIKGIKNGQSDYWLCNLKQEFLEFLEYKPYIGRLSPA